MAYAHGRSTRHARLSLDAFTAGLHPELLHRLANLVRNYAALGVVLDLLARIDELEAAVRSGRRVSSRRSPSWT